MAKKRFDIHEWQANQVKKRLAEQNDDRPDNWRELPGYNPDHFYKDFDKVKKAAQDSSPGITKIKLPMSDIEDEVTIHQKNPSCYDTPDKCLDDVTISWGDESHNVDFKFSETVDKAKAYDEFDTDLYVAYADDDKWRFIVEVEVTPREFSGDGGTINNDESAVRWDTLEIDIDDSKADEEGKPFGFDDIPDDLKEHFKKLYETK